MKKVVIFGLVICFSTVCLSFSGQKNGKELTIITIDSTPKSITFTTNLQQYNYIDSVLRLALRVAGYELSTKDGDGLKAGLISIINFLNYEYQRQMAVDTVKKPIVKPSK